YDAHADAHDIFSFDFNNAQSNMTLTYTGSSIHISGVAFGGLAAGAGYDPAWSGLWNIDFTYNSVTDLSPADDDIVVTKFNSQTRIGSGTGSITWMDGTHAPIPLVDYAGSFTYTFRLGDEDNDLGHRGFDGISGWGWLNHGGFPHIGASDWLFIVE